MSGAELLGISRGAKLGRMQNYLKTHSSNETYEKAYKSFKKFSIIILVWFLIFSIIFAIVISYLSDKSELKITANNIAYEEKIMGYVGDGIVWYAMNNTRCEIDISDFGYDIHNYEYRESFNIYVDDNQHVVDIAPTDEEKDYVILMAYWFISSLVLQITTVCIYTLWAQKSKSKRNPGREWFTYVKWYDKNDIDGYWFAKDSETYELWYPGLND